MQTRKNSRTQTVVFDDGIDKDDDYDMTDIQKYLRVLLTSIF